MESQSALLLAPLALAIAASACGRTAGEETHAKAAPEEPDPPPGSKPAPAPDPGGAAVVFLLPDGSEKRVTVEVARTARQIQRGLMYREHLPPDGGMLFLMRRDKIQSFWMKNTLIPLDMIFVNGAMDVVGVVENAEPKTMTSRHVSRPSQYVIEVNGGWARKNGVGVGCRARFENVPPIGPADGPYD
ncbi:MAG TPA: DUF192 domain-containing protein [Kofleriaceae bacterium]|nr:DUF192 domain-containing protein [Kofleriaceae bacterium]